MPYCTNCGEEVDPDQRYCSYCGEPMDSRQRRDHAEQRSRSDDEWDDPPAVQGWSPEHQPGSPVPRKNALDTVVESARRLFGVPTLVVAFLAVGLFNASSAFFEPGPGFLITVVATVLGLVVGGTAHIFVDYEFRDGSTTFEAAASEVAGRLLSLVAILIIHSIVVFVGLLFFILPGIYLGARLVLAFPACVLAGRGATDSLSTSWKLTDGKATKLAGIIILSLLPTILISLVDAGSAAGETLEDPVFLLAIAPVTAILSGVVEMAIARVYLEYLPQPDQQDTTTPRAY